MNIHTVKTSAFVNIQWKTFAVCLTVPFIVELLSWIFTQNSIQVYSELRLPPLSPSPNIFPIVWTSMFFLMGVSSYLIFISESEIKIYGLRIYGLQLLVNFSWNMFFFDGKMFMISFICLCVLLVLIFTMSVYFYQINPAAAILQAPYFIWIMFVIYINFGVYILN